MCLVPVRGDADSIHMMTVPATEPDSSLDGACAVCSEVRLAMIDGVCVSCILDGMGAGMDNHLPRVYKPGSRERFEGGILTDPRITAR